MDKSEKRRRVKGILQRQRAAARSAFPLPLELLQEMFTWLDEQLESTPCDHSRRLTKQWLEDHKLAVSPVLAWLDSVGGCCDCEVILNAEGHVDDAVTGG